MLGSRLRGIALVTSMACTGLGACGSSDPLVGTWQNSASAGGLNVTVEVSFYGNGTGRLRTLTVYAADATRYAGCTQTIEASGYTWTSTGSEGGAPALAYDGANTTASVTRSGCTNADDNRPTITATGAVPAGTFASISGTYTVSTDGRTLSISSVPGGASVAVSFTRQ
jgi:hypothetical protein